VELSFMPYDLASGDQTVFWWKGNITPPKDWGGWDWFIEQYLRHVIERYGLAEVPPWYFEIMERAEFSRLLEPTDRVRTSIFLIVRAVCS